MDLKSTIIFLCGVGLGAGSTYFICKSKFEQQANDEAEELKRYYTELYSNKEETVSNDEEIEEAEEEEIVKEEPDYNDIIDKLNYNRYSTVVPNSEGQKRPAKRPYQISMDDYNTDTRQVKKIISYFEDDEVCMDNDTKEILENVAKDIGIDNLELINTEGNEEIYVRNEQLGIDYNIVSEPGSYEDFIDE